MSKVGVIPETIVSLSQVATGFASIEAAFQNTLSLDGSTPNALNADLDINNNDIINVNTLHASNIVVNGQTLTLPSDVTNNEPYVIVIAGQSNAAGSNSDGPNPASSSVRTWDALLGTWGDSDRTKAPWTYSTPDGNSGNNNIALARAHRIVEDTGRTVYVIMDFVGGTSIDQWVASGTASTRYAALKVKVEAAIRTLGVSTVDEIIWAQGEEDYTDSYATHLGNLVLLRNQFRSEEWVDYQTPIYMTGPSNLHDRYQWTNAIQYLCSKVDNACVYVPSNGLRTVYDSIGAGTPTPGAGDYTHFLGESLWELGYYRVALAGPSESHPALFYGRGIGPATPEEPTVLTTFSSMVSYDSWTATNTPTGPAATGSISWGFLCNADGNYSFALGYENATDNSSNYTMAGGRETTSTSTGDYSIGWGYQISLANTYTGAFGRGHTTADSGQLACGLFSEYVTAQANPVMFQVGGGTSTSVRRTRFGVRSDGVLEAKYLPAYADDTAAGSGGLTQGMIYRTTTGELRIKL